MPINISNRYGIILVYSNIGMMHLNLNVGLFFFARYHLVVLLPYAVYKKDHLTVAIFL